MRRRMKALLSGLVIAALTAGMLASLAGLVERKDSRIKFADFYAQDADFDVLFFGTSHMINGVFPMELWNDYGIVSYNMAEQRCWLPNTYWLLKNALDYTTPKVVVVDCYALSFAEEINAAAVHTTFDVVPMSITKVQAVNHLSDGWKRRLEFLWPFDIYHDRWDELISEDFAYTASVQKGADMRVDVATGLERPAAIDDGQVLAEDSTDVMYLRRIIELCRDRGIEVLLTYIPFLANDTQQMEANTARRVAEEYGVGCIDFLKTDVADLDTDYCDAGHLNASGGRKLTAYMGRYLVEQYHVADRRDDPAYSDWYDAYNEYTRFKAEILSADQYYDRSCNVTTVIDFKVFLSLLNDSSFSCCMAFSGGEPWEDSPVYAKLFKNMGVSSERLNANAPTLAVVDNSLGETFYLGQNERADTSFGQVTFIQTDEMCGVQIDGEDVMQLRPEAGVGVVVIDNADGSVAAVNQYSVAPAGNEPNISGLN